MISWTALRRCRVGRCIYCRDVIDVEVAEEMMLTETERGKWDHNPQSKYRHRAWPFVTAFGSGTALFAGW